MVLKTNSFPSRPKEEERLGEVRRDAEGKGYFYEFKKNKKKEEEKEEPKEAAPKKKGRRKK